MEKEKKLNLAETINIPKFSSNLNLESLGENYENTNGSLAVHMLRDVEVNLEEYENMLGREARTLLERTRELNALLQETLDSSNDMLDRGQLSINFYKENLKEISQLHKLTRALFENGKVVELESSSKELITTEDREKIETIVGQFVDKEGFVRFGEIAGRIMNQQSQYASRYIDGVIPGWPNLGEGLRFKGEAYDYHEVKIHKDDIEEFIRRKRDYVISPEKYKDKITKE